MTIHAVGARVHIGPPEAPIDAVVIAILIEAPDCVSYKVAWWNGRAREEQSVKDLEVRINPEKVARRAAIGFHGET